MKYYPVLTDDKFNSAHVAFYIDYILNKINKDLNEKLMSKFRTEDFYQYMEAIKIEDNQYSGSGDVFFTSDSIKGYGNELTRLLMIPVDYTPSSLKIIGSVGISSGIGVRLTGTLNHKNPITILYEMTGHSFVSFAMKNKIENGIINGKFKVQKKGKIHYLEPVDVK